MTTNQKNLIRYVLECMSDTRTDKRTFGRNRRTINGQYTDGETDTRTNERTFGRNRRTINGQYTRTEKRIHRRMNVRPSVCCRRRRRCRSRRRRSRRHRRRRRRRRRCRECPIWKAKAAVIAGKAFKHSAGAFSRCRAFTSTDFVLKRIASLFGRR